MPFTVMLSIVGWTKTHVGSLEAPRAVAMTLTGPMPAGMQLVKPLSQWPAQATPLGERVRIEVSLEENVIGTFRLVPEVVCTEAEKPTVAPREIELMLAGVKVTFPG